MCFSGGGGGISDKDMVTQQGQAQAMGMLQADHKKRFKKGVEKELMGWLNDDSTVADAGQAAGAQAGKQFDLAQTMQQNQMARTGQVLTPEQRAAMNAKQDLAKTATVTGETNRAKANEVALKQAVRNPMMNLGRQSLGQGMNLFSTAANLEQNRGQSNAMAEEQARQQDGQALATVASMAMMMMSDKRKKTDVSKMDTRGALAEVRGMNLKNWRYKDGVGPDTAMHRGPMAQEAPDSITNKEKTMINVHDELQLGMGAIQELAGKVDRIERRIRA